ncbi:MAG: ABC transporter permease [Lachnospiraceae bacterium]|nr:ABC transporter permease [Lachnospiraceae bacterium]
MEKLKAILSKIKYYRVICLSLSLIFLAIGIITNIILNAGRNKYDDQTMSARWDSEGSSAHISMFIKDIAHFTKNDIEGLEYELNKQLDLNSIEAPNEDARRFVDCYMAKSSITLETEQNTIDVECMAVGGDFFLFHPIRLASGSYFAGSDLTYDGIILDEATAWRLFGSSNIVGQKVLFGDRVLFIKGVYKREDDKVHYYARGDKPEIYVPFDLLDSADAPLDIVSFEVCMPNPIENFANKIITDIVKLDTSNFEVVNNSERFTIENLWKLYKGKKYRSMQNRDIIYPYWEKIARFQEDRLSPYAVVMCVTYISSATIFLCLVLYEVSKLTRLRSRNDD